MNCHRGYPIDEVSELSTEDLGELGLSNKKAASAVRGLAKVNTPTSTPSKTGADLEKIRSALAAIKDRADDYDDWVGVGFALKNAVRKGELSDADGLELFDEFSRFSEGKYPGRDAIEDKWFNALDGNPENPRTLGSVFHDAKQAGWVDPTAHGAVIVRQPQVPAMRSAFDPDTLDESQMDWPILEIKGKRQMARADVRNVQYLLKKIGAVVWFDEFSLVPRIDWFRGAQELDDAAMRTLFVAAKRLGLEIKKDFFYDCVLDIAHKDARHPVRDYLDAVKWDGKPRIERALIDYFKAPNTPFVRAVSKIVFLALVRRVRQPGCKFDEILVLESPEGYQKSSALRALAPDPALFTDTLHLGAGSKDTIEQTAGKWIVEVSELGGMERKEVEHVKAQASRQTDRARLAYARSASDVPRQWVMIGTTNKGTGDAYLKSTTGNRRFWPIEVGRVDVNAIIRDRDQLWAEASHLEASGKSIRLPKYLWSAAAAEQEARREVDPMEADLFDAIVGVKGFVPAHTLYDILGLGDQRDRSKRSQRHASIIARVMKDHGWKPTRRKNGTVRGYENDPNGPWLAGQFQDGVWRWSSQNLANAPTLAALAGHQNTARGTP